MKPLDNIKIFALSGVLVSGLGAPSLSAPAISGETGLPECRQALAIANADFNSDTVRLTGPLTIPESLGSDLVLKIASGDISGGDAQGADPTVFKKISGGVNISDLRNIYWQLVPSGGKRIVVTEREWGWHGDLYNYYLTNEATDPHSFTLGGDEQKKIGLIPMIEEAGTPLQFLKDTSSNRIWAIDLSAEQSWSVYVQDGSDFSARCHVAFFPEIAGKFSVPASTARFKALLEDALGPGNNEGTLQPTSRIRVEAKTIWINALYRPWALGSAYNTTEGVNSGLAEWAGKAKSFHKVYHALHMEYAHAEEGLAQHYASRFHLPPDQARVMAKYATDVIYRTYFVFPAALNGGKNQEPSNPWPQMTR